MYPSPLCFYPSYRLAGFLPRAIRGEAATPPEEGSERGSKRERWKRGGAGERRKVEARQKPNLRDSSQGGDAKGKGQSGARGRGTEKRTSVRIYRGTLQGIKEGAHPLHSDHNSVVRRCHTRVAAFLRAIFMLVCVGPDHISACVGEVDVGVPLSLVKILSGN